VVRERIAAALDLLPVPPVVLRADDRFALGRAVLPFLSVGNNNLHSSYLIELDDEGKTEDSLIIVHNVGIGNLTLNSKRLFVHKNLPRIRTRAHASVPLAL